MMVAGFAVAIFVWLLIFWSILRYRKRKGDNTVPRQFHEHIALEWTYTIIPLLMVGVIFYFTVVVENQVDNTLAPPAVIVNVTGYQWGWRFAYSKPDGGVIVQTAPGAAPSALAKPYSDTKLYPQLVLPEGETVRFFLRSTDVIHGFYVRDFNFSRYVQPGVVNQFEIKPTSTGVFAGQCTQYCGLYHSEMLFSVRVVTASQFNTWISQQTRSAS
jgi:cytochrome c oxidase subunit 2